MILRTTRTLRWMTRVSGLLGLHGEQHAVDCLRMRAALARVSKADFPAFAARVHALCAPGDYLSTPAHNYSSGLLTRLNFALSIGIDPDIFIFDEWLSVADGAFHDKAELMRFSWWS